MNTIIFRFMFLILETLRHILGVLLLDETRFNIEKDGITEKIKDIGNFHNSITGFNSLFAKQTLQFLNDDQLASNILLADETLDLMNDNPNVINWWLKLSPKQRFELIINDYNKSDH